jgi:hypothetical protein
MIDISDKLDSAEDIESAKAAWQLQLEKFKQKVAVEEAQKFGARIALANVSKWLDKAFTEYLAAPRETGKALPLMKWLRLELAKMASGEREIPGPQ